MTMNRSYFFITMILHDFQWAVLLELSHICDKLNSDDVSRPHRTVSMEKPNKWRERLLIFILICMLCKKKSIRFEHSIDYRNLLLFGEQNEFLVKCAVVRLQQKLKVLLKMMYFRLSTIWWHSSRKCKTTVPKMSKCHNERMQDNNDANGIWRRIQWWWPFVWNSVTSYLDNRSVQPVPELSRYVYFLWLHAFTKSWHKALAPSRCLHCSRQTCVTKHKPPLLIWLFSLQLP